MSAAKDRLRELGLVGSPPKAPVANDVGTKRSGDLLFVSDAMLDLLAIIKHDIGDGGEASQHLTGITRTSAAQ